MESGTFTYINFKDPYDRIYRKYQGRVSKRRWNNIMKMAERRFSDKFTYLVSTVPSTYYALLGPYEQHLL